jgi:hypothetical protein
VTLDGFAARLEVVPFPSVVVAGLGEARNQKAREGREFTRAESAATPGKGTSLLVP